DEAHGLALVLGSGTRGTVNEHDGSQGVRRSARDATEHERCGDDEAASRRQSLLARHLLSSSRPTLTVVRLAPGSWRLSIGESTYSVLDRSAAPAYRVRATDGAASHGGHASDPRVRGRRVRPRASRWLSPAHDGAPPRAGPF